MQAVTIWPMAITTIRMSSTEIPDALRLMAWLSPGYPVGAYAYSHGLEWAVEAGDIRYRLPVSHGSARIAP